MYATYLCIYTYTYTCMYIFSSHMIPRLYTATVYRPTEITLGGTRVGLCMYVCMGIWMYCVWMYGYEWMVSSCRFIVAWCALREWHRLQNCDNDGTTTTH